VDEAEFLWIGERFVEQLPVAQVIVHAKGSRVLDIEQ